jgi:hypothetical protein
MAETRATVTGELSQAAVARGPGQAAVAMPESRLSFLTPAETSPTDSGTCNRVEPCEPLPRDGRSGFSATCSPLPHNDRSTMCSPPHDDRFGFCGLSCADDSKMAFDSEPCSSSHDDDSKAWVIDSGASDNMTFDPTDFTTKS